MQRAPVAPFAIMFGSPVVHVAAWRFVKLVLFDQVVPPSILSASMDLILKGPLKYPGPFLPPIATRPTENQLSCARAGVVWQPVKRILAEPPNVSRTWMRFPLSDVENGDKARRVLGAVEVLIEKGIVPSDGTEAEPAARHNGRIPEYIRRNFVLKLSDHTATLAVRRNVRPGHTVSLGMTKRIQYSSCSRP